MQGQGAGPRGELPFGLADVTASHPIAVGLVDWSSARATVIVKIALQQDGAGHLALAPLAAPLCLDTFDEQGNLIFATDFAPYKPACDVFVVEEADGRAEAGRFELGPIDLHVSRGETLGPRESTFDSGNPTGAREAWTQPSFDFASFQSSPPSRRVPWPRSGFDVHLDRSDLRFHARFVEPFPVAVVLGPDGMRVLARPTLVLDTVAVDARAAELVLCFRGIVDDARGALQGCTLHIELRGAAGQLLAAAGTRSIEPQRADDAVLSSRRGGMLDDSTTTATGRSFLVEETQVAPMARPAARPLPFAGADRRPLDDDGPKPAQSLAALRAEAERPVLPAWEAVEGTVALRRSPAADLPEPPLPTPTPSDHRWPMPVSPPSAAAYEPEAPTPPQPRRMMPDEPPTTTDDGPRHRALEPDEPPTTTDDGAMAGAPLSDDPSTTTHDSRGSQEAQRAAVEAATVAAVQREIWKGEQSLAEILASQGLSEVEWRAMKQRPRRS